MTPSNIDLTLLTTDWDVLHRRVMRGNFRERERERGRGRECIIGGCCGQLIQARAMIMIVSGECDIRVPMVETGEPQSVPQLAPCDPGHLTHPTDICQPDQQPQSGHNLSD